MPLASTYSYPLLGAFWTILEIFLWVLWIWVLIYVFIDIFRSHDLSGWAKALWFLFVLFIPLIGVLVYLIARGDQMHERAVGQAQQQDPEARHYIQEAAGSPTTADQLTKLADLRDRGVITAEEFDREKAKVLPPERLRAGMTEDVTESASSLPEPAAPAWLALGHVRPGRQRPATPARKRRRAPGRRRPHPGVLPAGHPV